MKKPGSRKERSGFSSFQVILLILGALAVHRMILGSQLISDDFSTRDFKEPTSSLRSSHHQISYFNPLGIPEGKAQNLPSIRVEDENLDRAIYGGKGDKKHLGGFTELDMHGIAPGVWKHAVQNWTVQSVLDVGCGKGTSTSWFVTHGLRTECVEGSHDAIEQSMVPDKSILTEHDFSRGPWWPEDTFDMVWSVEFLEHVNLHNHFNYITTFRKAAIIMVTSSKWGGWHHVEVHEDDWWIRKYESYGFQYDEILTQEIRQVAKNDRGAFPPNGENLNAQHVWMSMKVFINPAVAALPQHAHLFGAPGCFTNYGEPNRECGKPKTRRQKKTAEIETPLDPSYYPLKLTEEQDQAWYDIVKANIKQPEQ